MAWILGLKDLTFLLIHREPAISCKILDILQTLHIGRAIHAGLNEKVSAEAKGLLRPSKVTSTKKRLGAWSTGKVQMKHGCPPGMEGLVPASVLMRA